MKTVTGRQLILIVAMVGAALPRAVRGADEPRGTLDVVATAHLDTQWRWTVRNSIEEYIPATLRNNAALMDRYPGYVFSFEGAFRYMLLKEYYPEDYERLKRYVAEGRWRVAGSWVDAVDVNIPSFESLVRQTLYGNGFFKQEFGKTSRDVFLPDCFGFGFALPSIAAHCGLRSFSTQKLAWGSAYGVPFDIGTWEGVDGSTLIASLDPGDYTTRIRSDLSRDSTRVARADELARTSGVRGGYMYFGTGDTGGSPDSLSVDWLAKSMQGDGPLEVRSVGSDDLVELVSSAGDGAHLARYRGELLMTRHGVGCYTSEAAMKRWNRRNELLADATERAAVMANLVGGTEYPRTGIRDTWVRFLWHQFHDDVTGTSIPEAYEISWNDELLCQNRLAGMLETSVAATTPELDTRVKGFPVVAYNPLAGEREDLVEASVVTGARASGRISVHGPDGKEVASQVTADSPDSVRVLFLARVPSVGYAVYDVRCGEKPGRALRAIAVTDSTLENDRYRVALNADGDVASIIDKRGNRELLAAPIQWQLIHDKPKQWPAWEIQYEDLLAGPRAVVGGPATRRIVEPGPARGAIEITRHSEQATYRTVVRLAAGSAGDRVVFDSDVEWGERETLLKAAFQFTTAADSITYDLGLGAIARGTNRPELYEVPGHQWADMSGVDAGAAVLNDCKYGWDHPDAGTLRLTLLHTPGVFDSWSWVGDQHTMDIGHHRFSYAVTGHHGDWREGAVPWEAARLNQPLIAFQVPAHKGPLGKNFSLVSLASPAPSMAPPPALLSAVKMAEASDEIVVRVREPNGRALDRLELRFARAVVSAREITGAEEPKGEATIERGVLVTALTPYQPRAFAVRLAAKGPRPPAATVCAPIALPFDLDGVSLDANRTDGDFDGMGNTLAGELLPDTLAYAGTRFVFGLKTAGALNVVRSQGQSLRLPEGNWNRLDLLLAATGGPADAAIMVNDRRLRIQVQDWGEPIAQWWNRIVAGSLLEDRADIAPAYILRAPIAWYGTHRHNAEGTNDAYRYSYLYLLRLDLPADARTVTLPRNERVKVLAASAIRTASDPLRAAQPLYDVADATVAKISVTHHSFIDSTEIRLATPIPGATLHYTLDGSEPTATSALYQAPIVLRSTGTVKARAILEGSDDHHVAAVAVTRQTPRAPLLVKNYLSGLRCRYYEGEWSRLPDFDTLKVAHETAADSIGIPDFARDEDYALSYDGYVEVPREGMYTFSIESDDGSALYVADSLLVDNDGLHGATELGGDIALRKGFHRFRAIMFQRKGDEAFAVRVSGPGIEKRPLPRGMMRR